MTRRQWATVDRFDTVYAELCAFYGLTEEQARALRGQRCRVFQWALTECLRDLAGPLPVAVVRNPSKLANRRGPGRSAAVRARRCRCGCRIPIKHTQCPRCHLGSQRGLYRHRKAS